MSPGRAALIVTALALAIAEIVRPTTIPAKRIGHATMLGIAGTTAIDPEELDDLPPIVQPAIGNVDVSRILSANGDNRPVGDGRMHRADVLELAGWCADPEAESAGSVLLALVDDRTRIPAPPGAYGLLRPDVVRALGRGDLLRSGFDLRLSADRLGPGRHVVKIGVIARSQRGIFIFPVETHVEVGP